MADISDLRIDHSATRRDAAAGWRAAFLALAAVVVIAAIGGGTWFLRSGATAADRIDNADPSTRPTENTGASQPRSSRSGFTAAGYIEVVPPGERVISPLIAGMVREIHVREGTTVQSGELVASLDPSLLERELDLSRAEVDVLRARILRLEAGFLPEEIAQSQARILAAEAAQTFAAEHLARQRRLAETGATSDRAVLEAESDLRKAEAALVEAQSDLRLKQLGTRPEDIAIAGAELARAEAAASHIKWKIAQCEIRAPAPGVVYQQLAQPGQWVTPEAGQRGSGIVSIFDPRALQVWVDVNQRDIAQIALGQRVTMVADSAPLAEIPGTVRRIMPRASIERNTLRIKIALDGEHDGLRPDMSVRVTFHQQEEPSS